MCGRLRNDLSGKLSLLLLAKGPRIDAAIDSAEAEMRQAQLNNTMQTMVEQIEQERNMLATLSEVRPTDVAVSQAELERAEIAVAQQQADLEETQVRRLAIALPHYALLF